VISSFENWGHLDAWVDEATKEDVNAAFPRDGWNDVFARAIEEELRLVKSGVMRPMSLNSCRTKPWSHMTSLLDKELVLSERR
jgi:hypothetical protein